MGVTMRTTFYTVKLVHGYIAPGYRKWMGMAPMHPKITPRVEDAEIMTRHTAIAIARETGGTAVMLTRTGKIRVVHP